jgi:uncharacterized protein YecT (DUF1311 family)
MIATLFLVAASLPACSVSAGAGDEKPTAADRTAVADCIALAATNQENLPTAEQDAQPGAAAKLQREVIQTPGLAASCIGVIAEPCQNEPDGQSNLGMAQCYDREAAVWDERLNQNYKKRLDAAEPAYRDALKKMQRTWIAYRDAKCGSISIGETGSISVPETAICMLDETARQAIFLEPDEQ